MILGFADSLSLLFLTIVNMPDKDKRYYRPLPQDGDEQPLPVQGPTYKGYAIVSTILLILSISMNIKFIVAEFLSPNNPRTEYG